MREAGQRPRLNVVSKEMFLSLYLPAIALSLGQGIAAPVLPVYVKSFGVSFEIATLIIIVHGIGNVAATLPVGFLIDRIGRRPVLLTGPIVTALMSFATAFAQSFPELLVYRFIGGAASGMWQLSRLTMIADTGRDRERGRMITWMMQTYRAGNLLSPALGGFIAVFWDIRVPFIIHGILTLLAIIPSFRVTKETAPTRRPSPADDGSPPSDWRYVFAEMVRPTMAAFLAAQFLANVTRGLGRGGVLYLYMTYTYGVGPAALGVVASANSLLSLPVGFATGYIMDRWGRKKTIVPGFSLLSVAMLFMAATALFHTPFEVFVASYFAVNFAQAITGGNMQVLGSDLAPRYARGRFIAAWRLIAEAGHELAVPGFTVAGLVFGYFVAFGSLSVTSLAVALIVGLLIAETVGRSRQTEEEEAEAAAGPGPTTPATSAVGAAEAGAPAARP